MRALLIVSTLAHYNYLTKVADALACIGYVPVFYLEVDVSDKNTLVNRVSLDGYFFTDGTKSYPPEVNISSSKEFVKPSIYQFSNAQFKTPSYQKVRKYFARLKALVFFPQLLYISQKAYVTKKIINSIKPSLLITAEDIGYGSPYLVSAAKKLNIPSIVCPFSMANSEEYIFSKTLYNIYPSNRSIASKINFFLITTFFPTWVKECNGRKYTKSDYFLIPLVCYFFGGYVLNPWTITGGKSDVVFVESDFIKDYYVKAGTCSEKIKIVGAYRDRKANFRADDKFSLAKKIGADAALKWVVFSPSPDHINNDVYPDYATMFTNVIGLMQHANVVVIVSLHPRLKKEDFNFISESYQQLVLVEGQVEMLIEFCDLFIASGSASIRYALAFRKPIINYNLYKLPYSEYDSLPMVKKCEDEELFMKHYKEIITCSDSGSANDNDYGKYPANYFGGNSSSFVDELMNLLPQT